MKVLGVCALVSISFLACGGGGPDLVGAPGVAIEEIAMYQGVKRTLIAGENSDIPLVANRDALMRVYATSTAEYNREPVLARLTLITPSGDEQVFEEVVGSIPVRPDEGLLATTINFWLPGDVIQPDTNYRLELLQESATAAYNNEDAAFPKQENLVLPLGAVDPLRSLEVVLVPVETKGLNPDVSADQIERYRIGFMNQYPASEVNISVREPVAFDSELTAGGGGWGTLLNNIAELRSRDGVGPEIYYYGIFTPAASLGQFCGGGGCVLGLGFVPDETNTYMRAAIGLGFTGEDSVDTSVHEIGHTHGRQHAPCGTGDPDPQFPNPGASIGSWGLSLSSRELKDPSLYTDFMGYCEDTWVSDYTYKALYERMRIVDGQRALTSPKKTYGRIAIGENGELTTLSPVTLESDIPMNRSFRATADSGDILEGKGHFAPYDHIEGGLMLVPEDYADLQITSLELGAER